MAPPRPEAWRLFYALPLSEPARAEVAAIVEPLRGRFAAARWASPATYHLTLLFLGDVPPVALPELQVALAAAAGVAPPFGCVLSASGSFGESRSRPAWLGLDARSTRAAAALATALQVRLAVSAEPALAAAARAAADRPFRAHLTVCRGAEPALTTALGSRFAEHGPVRWRAEAIELQRSRLLAGGPEHRAIAQRALGSRAGALPSAERATGRGDGTAGADTAAVEDA